MVGQTFYCTYNAFNQIFQNSRSLKKWEDLILRFSHLCLDLKYEDVEKESKCNPSLNRILKRTSLKFDPLGSYFMEMLNDSELEQRGNGFDIFIVEKTPEETAVLRNKFGLLVLSNDEFYTNNCLFGSYKKKINDRERIFTEMGKVNLKGWQSIFYTSRFKINPCNSLLIIDNYLFDEREEAKEISARNDIKNIVGFIEGILPESLVITFQIMLVINNDHSRFNTQKLNEIKHEILSQLGVNRNYNISLDILTHNKHEKIHRRCVISNYHFIELDKGIYQFKGELSKQLNDLKIFGAYHTVNSDDGTCEIEYIFEYKSILKNILANIAKGKLEKVEFTLDGGKNRLLN